MGPCSSKCPCVLVTAGRGPREGPGLSAAASLGSCGSGGSTACSRCGETRCFPVSFHEHVGTFNPRDGAALTARRGRGPWLSQQDLRAIERPGVTGEGPGGAPGQVCSESVPRVPSSLPSFLLSIIFATLCKYKTCDALRGPEWSWIYGENEA